MQCPSCGSKWESKASVSTCPFCGEKLTLETPVVFSGVPEVFAYLQKNYGNKVFTESKLTSLLSDFLPNRPKELRLVKVALESGAYSEIVHADRLSDSEKQICLEKQRKKLEDYYCLDAEWAEKVVHWLSDVLGWSCSQSSTAVFEQLHNNTSNIQTESSALRENSRVRTEHENQVGSVVDWSRFPKPDIPDFEFTQTENGIKLDKYIGTKEALVIPDNYSGVPVTEISDRAFAWCRNLISVFIPDSVLSIGKSAFEGCTDLTSIRISNSITCIEIRLFRCCQKLTSVNIPEYVTEICNLAFDHSGITSIIIPDNVVRIGKRAFRGCRQLSSVIISRSVTNIEECAFEGCMGLTALTIPKSVASIGKSAFCYCSRLNQVNVSPSNTHFCTINNILFNKNADALVSYPAGLTDSTYSIPDSVTHISAGAFEGCESLKSVIIPDSIMSIGDNAFSGCLNLSSVDIPDSVNSIGEGVFAYCEKNESFAVSPKNSYFCSVDGVLFSRDMKTLFSYPAKSDRSAFRVPDSVMHIGDYAFSMCEKLTSVYIPTGVESIGEGAFYCCSNLANASIPNGVTFIRDKTFYICNSLTSVNIPESVTSIGALAFNWCGKLVTIHIPDSVTSIHHLAFENCREITVVCNQGSYAHDFCIKSKIKYTIV